jgi:hypothetical protein
MGSAPGTVRAVCSANAFHWFHGSFATQFSVCDAKACFNSLGEIEHRGIVQITHCFVYNIYIIHIDV